MHDIQSSFVYCCAGGSGLGDPSEVALAVPEEVVATSLPSTEMETLLIDLLFASSALG